MNSTRISIIMEINFHYFHDIIRWKFKSHSRGDSYIHVHFTIYIIVIIICKNPKKKLKSA